MLTALILGVNAPASAQQGGFDTSRQWKIEQLGKDHWKLTGAVEAQRGEMRFFADEIETWTDEHRVVATGNVVFIQGQSRIAADRADFNTETRLGTFFNATGSTEMGTEPKRDRMGGQEPDVYFYGDEIEKIGDKKYKIRNGGFTTCLQPTPRWQLTSGTVILNLDHYAFLTNALLKAKNVPVFYLPVMYYPINKEDRSTGFLMPNYGTSSYRGFTLNNAFFWAVNRSHDVTLMHDYFAKTGQGMGAEYRYALGPGSQGTASFYRLNEHAFTDSAGATQAGTKSYKILGNGSYVLGKGWSARGRVDYFSSLRTQQLYQTNIYDASNRQRSYSGSLTGSLAGLSFNGSWDRSEYFTGTDTSTVYGGTPRINLSRGDRPLFGIVYFSAAGEYVKLVRQYKDASGVSDNTVQRLDVTPVIRVPFTKLRWLTVNSSITWRDTYWTRSLDQTTSKPADDGVNRRYFDLASRITGPVFNRVWNTPHNGYAEKWKHTIEPFVNIQRVTMIDEDVYDRIIKLDGADYTIGGTTRIDYGLTNRLLVKRRTAPGAPPSSARDIFAVAVTQTYYTNAAASQYDLNYSTSFSGRTPSNYSPIRIAITASPAERINAGARIEYDHEARTIQSISASGQAAVSDWLQVNGGYSMRKLKSGLEIVGQADSMNGSTTVHTPGNRFGGGYTFNYDLTYSKMLNSRLIAYYNAQCCGISFEYQTYNFPSTLRVAIPRDNRFTFNITLAGLGSFSPFFGSMGGM
jgi:lipopolysaccharide assembly outer membrane protein LptD (OstA)